MQLFNNLKVGTKIITGYLIVLALMLVIGGVTFVRLNQLNNIVIDLTNNLAVDRQLANDIVAQIMRARLYANNYIFDSQQANLERYQLEMGSLDKATTQADTEITKAEQIEMLKNIETDVAAYKAGFDEIVGLMANRAKARSEVLDVQAPLVQDALLKIQENAFQTGDVTAVNYAGLAEMSVQRMRVNMLKYLEDGDPQWSQKFDERYAESTAAISKLDGALTGSAQWKLLDEASVAIEAYATGFRSLQADYDRQHDLKKNTLDVVGPRVRQTAMDMVESVGKDFEAEALATDELVAETRTLLIVVVAVAVLIALGLGFAISRAITRPLGQVARAAGAMAEGDLNQTLNIQSKDEVGSMAAAFERMIAYLQGMARVAGNIAQNDLTDEVTALSEQDVLGNAFVRMISNLRLTIGQVSENANSLSAASEQLAAAANQSGQASSQIRVTIQQVAKGTAQQSESVTRTAASVEQMGRAIDGVAKGAQEQASAVEKASGVTGQISTGIQQVAASAQAQAKGAAESVQITQSSAKTVEETIRGMQNIKAKVGLSAQKVQEMGSRSDQIGAIVETIDDIASQTNLLALNAAIEAARAGEHGKGFAVVADEVRKLAEKSAGATKEIAALIKGIQQTVGEAVQAMTESAGEVENGVNLACQSGKALEEILQAAEASNRYGDEIAAAAEKMSTLSNELVSAVDSVSAVVEENTAATEEMAAGSGDVTQAIENIASVSEENSAAVEEVSASAEEMTAQVEEVTASAQSLAEMAKVLKKLVSQFELGDSFTTGQDNPESESKPVYVGPDRRVPLAETLKTGEGGNGHSKKVVVG
jgi:methyl-accepting chemotaxis protein